MRPLTDMQRMALQRLRFHGGWTRLPRSLAASAGALVHRRPDEPLLVLSRQPDANLAVNEYRITEAGRLLLDAG